MVMNYADEHTLKDGLEQVALWNSAFLASSDLGTQCARTHTHTHTYTHTHVHARLQDGLDQVVLATPCVFTLCEYTCFKLYFYNNYHSHIHQTSPLSFSLTTMCFFSRRSNGRVCGASTRSVP